MTNVDASSRVEYRHHSGEAVVDPALVESESDASDMEADLDDDDDLADVAEAFGVRAVNVTGISDSCG